MLFNPDNHMEDIKIHHIATAQRLFEREFVTLADGGYRTLLGLKALEYVQSPHTMLNAHRDSN